MKFPSWGDFRDGTTNFEHSIYDQKTRFAKRIRVLKDDHPIFDEIIKIAIPFLPSPFNGIAQGIYSSFEGSKKDKVDEVLKFLKKIQSQTEEQYTEITSKLGNVLGEISDIKAIIAKNEGTLQLIKEILISKDNTINQKLDLLKNELDSIKKLYEKHEKDLYQNSGLNWLSIDFFESHKCAQYDFDKWKQGFDFDLPCIRAQRELRRNGLIADIKGNLEKEGKLLIVGQSGISKSTILMEIMCDLYEIGFIVLYNYGTNIGNADGLINYIEDLLTNGKKVLIAVDNAHDERTAKIYYIIDKLSSFEKAKNLRFLITARTPELDNLVNKRFDKVEEEIRQSIRKLLKNPTFRYPLPYFTQEEVTQFIKLYLKFDNDKVEKKSQEVYEYTKGDPIMIKFAVFGHGLDNDVEEMYNRYLNSELKLRTMLICSLLGLSKIEITNDVLERSGVLLEAYSLDGTTIYSYNNLWKTRHPRWDQEFFSFLYNQKNKGLLELRKQVLFDSFIGISSIQDENINYSTLTTLTDLADQKFIPISVADFISQKFISPLRQLSNEKKSDLLSRIAVVHYENKNYREALDKLDKALRLNSRNVEAYNIKGLTLMKPESGLRHVEAVECFDKALEIDDKLAYVWMNRGNALDNSGNNRKAIESYRKALEFEINPWHIAGILNNMGICFDNLGQIEEARRCYNKAINIEQSQKSSAMISEDHKLFVQKHTWYLKGNLLLKLEKYLEARACYNKSLNFDSSDADTLLNEGLCFIKLQEYEEAIKSNSKVLKFATIPRQRSEAWNNMGICFYYLGQIEEARRCYNKATEMDPKNGRPWYNKSKLGGSDAQECFDKAKELGFIS